jgi:hypothetical protein
MFPTSPREYGTTMDNQAVILPAYVDKAGERGLVRELTTERDEEISLMSAAREGDRSVHARLRCVSQSYVRSYTSPMRLSRGTRLGERWPSPFAKTLFGVSFNFGR